MERNIPEFMQGFYDGSDEEGRIEIEKAAARYEQERQLFLQTTFNEKRDFQRDWNKLTGDNKKLTVEEALAPMNHKYQQETKEIAVKHGYIEPEVKEQTNTATQQAEEGQGQNSTKEQQSKREEFLANLKNIREQNAKHTHRPRR